MAATAEFGGVVIPEALARQNFYGMRLDPATGRLTVDVIANGDGVVQLPQEGVIDALDYRQWLWSPTALSFEISEKGHLEMTLR